MCKTLNIEKLNLKSKSENEQLTLSTVTKFRESSCILLLRRNSELGLTPGDSETKSMKGQNEKLHFQ